MAGTLIPFGIKSFDLIIGGGVFPGTCILLLTSPTSEARLLCAEFLYKTFANKVPGLFIAMDESPELLKMKALRYNWALSDAELSDDLKWVDGYSAKANIKASDTRAIKRVSGPLALSDISIAISGAQSLFYRKSSTFKLVFDSISTLSLYSSPETIYRFMQVVTAKIKTSGGIGLFVLIEGMHNPDFVMTIRHMMDATITLDENLNFNILSFPTETRKKKGRFVLSKSGFVVAD